MWQERGKELGYNEAFLSKECGLTRRSLGDIQHLFSASCGSGCPLRLLVEESVSLKGKILVDLGCGAGHDVILGSQLVGPSGRVVGVDMTPEMIDAAKENASKYCTNEENVEFVQANLEDDLPSLQNQADVVISNGVLNLVDEKRHAFASAYKILKPGGRLVFSDLCQVPTNPKAILASSTVTDS